MQIAPVRVVTDAVPCVVADGEGNRIERRAVGQQLRGRGGCRDETRVPSRTLRSSLKALKQRLNVRLLIAGAASRCPSIDPLTPARLKRGGNGTEQCAVTERLEQNLYCAGGEHASTHTLICFASDEHDRNSLLAA